MTSIRNQYAIHGVSEYYKSQNYINPHRIHICELLGEVHKQLPFERVLDLSCGDGVVTKKLMSLGYTDITGTDPYLVERYESETGKVCLPLSFKDMVMGKSLGERYSCIICSFALHLCEKSMLKQLLWQLGQYSDKLVVISPTKFPIIDLVPVMTKYIVSDRKRTQLRVYSLCH